MSTKSLHSKSLGVRSLCTLLLAGMMLSGCTFIRIQNVADNRLRVAVKVPDNTRAYTRTIRPGQIADVFSSHGGRYSVTLLSPEGYEQILQELKAEISDRLFKEGASLTAAEVANLTQNLSNIDQLIEANENMDVSCSGSVPDFETAVVILSFDSTTDKYSLVCN